MLEQYSKDATCASVGVGPFVILQNVYLVCFSGASQPLQPRGDSYPIPVVSLVFHNILFCKARGRWEWSQRQAYAPPIIYMLDFRFWLFQNWAMPPRGWTTQSLGGLFAREACTVLNGWKTFKYTTRPHNVITVFKSYCSTKLLLLFLRTEWYKAPQINEVLRKVSETTQNRVECMRVTRPTMEVCAAVPITGDHS